MPSPRRSCVLPAAAALIYDFAVAPHGLHWPAAARVHVIILATLVAAVASREAWPASIDGTWRRLAYDSEHRSPGARASLGGVYASQYYSSHLMLVVGGIGPAGLMNDAWQMPLSGDLSWVALTAHSPPPARESFSLVNDHVFGDIYLFGGSDTSPRGDLWVERIVGRPFWSERSQHPATPRTAHAAAAVGATGTMMVFGGRRRRMGVTETGYLNDLWLYDSRVGWDLLEVSGPVPEPRAYATMIYDPSRRTMIVYGGEFAVADSCTDFCTQVYSDVWEISATHPDAWVRRTDGPRRTRHTTIYDAARDRMVVFGGHDETGSYSNDVWAFSLADGSWTRLAPSGPVPAPRASHAAI